MILELLWFTAGIIDNMVKVHGTRSGVDGEVPGVDGSPRIETSGPHHGHSPPAGASDCSLTVRHRSQRRQKNRLLH